jgi:molecular chaperone DnaK
LDSLVYNTEKMLKENRDAISEKDATSLDEALSKAKTTLENSAEAAELNAAFEELTKASHRLAEAMYQKTAGQAQPKDDAGAATAGEQGEKRENGGGEDEVIDAEYVDMDKKE